MTKQEIRKLMGEKRNQLSDQLKLKMDLKIHDRLFNLKEYRECSYLFTYFSFKTEPDTIDIIRRALSEKKRLYLPRVEGRAMNFYEIRDFSSLKRSRFGIYEPDESHEICYGAASITDKDIKLMLLPGLAFDLMGNRIGYGAGYYDRYLSEHAEDCFILAALSYDFQVLERIDAMEYDIRTDLIITPNRLLRPRK